MTIDVVVPVHNEGVGIAQTLREFHNVAQAQGVSVRFVVCEDGSTDDTVDVLTETGRELPMKLLTSPQRKGYSRAALDGLRAASTEVVVFVDSDGQCDPHDLGQVLAALKGADLVTGSRTPRIDSLMRKTISRAFGLVYKLLFPVRLEDPSSPFIAVRKDALDKILSGNPGILSQGFWWEFNARAASAGVRSVEIPVHHRPRSSGKTQVYKLRRLPTIAAAHIRGLFKLRRELSGR